MPSRAEKILRIVYWVGLCLYIIATLGNVLFFRIAFAMNGAVPWLALLQLRRILGLTWPISFALWVCSSFAMRWLAGKRNKGKAPAQVAILSESVNPPAVHVAFRPVSILALAWTSDYKSSLRQSVNQVFLRPSMWLSWSVTGVIFTLLFPGFDSTSDPSFYVNHLEAFMAGVAVSSVITCVGLAFSMRKHFPANAPVQHVGLIVDPGGLRSIIGAKSYSYRWDVIGKVRNVGGAVLYQRHGVLSLIPDYAFRSNGDCKAFVATLDALKKGLPPPPYDWSAYVPVAPSSEGVWPPPIA